MTDPIAELAVAALRANNLVTWLRFEALKLGTDNQRERYAAGVLPDDELTALARGELYKPLEGWTRWGNRDLNIHAVRHRGHGLCGPADVKFSHVGGAELPKMDGDAWNKLTELRHAVNKINCHPWLMHSHTSAVVEVSKHEARCEKCRAVAVRYTARVVIPWADHVLTREYLLSGAPDTVRS